MSTSDILENLKSRLDYIEKIFPSLSVLRDKINAYDKLIEENNNLKKQINDLNLKHEDLKGKLSQSEQVQSSLANTISNVNLGVSQISNSTLQGISEAKEARKKYDLDLKNLELRLVANQEAVNANIKSQIKAKPDKADIDLSYNILKVMINDLMSKFEAHKTDLDAFKQRVHSEQSSILDMNVSQAQHKKDLKANQDQITDLKLDIMVVRDSMDTQLKEIRQVLNHAYQDLREDISNQSSYLLSQKEEHDKKLESISQDAEKKTNHLQKSDQRIFLIEKNIESIKYLLNR